jgi:hypothetical protein
VRWLRRDPWSREGRLLGLIAGVIVLFNGFLLFTYIAHFPAPWALEAHSYFRYNTQISLLLMLGLVVGLRPWIAAWMTAHQEWAAQAGRAAVGIVLLAPIAGAPLLRFDLDTPQPELRRLAHAAATYLAPGDRVALLLPRDFEDSIGSFMRGVLLFTPPRHPDLDFHIETSMSAATLPAVAAAGYRLAVLSCAPPGIDGVSAGDAAILQARQDGWRVLQAWAWPEQMRQRQFAGMLARDPLCAGPRPH